VVSIPDAAGSAPDLADPGHPREPFSPRRRVVVYPAQECHLCARALAVVGELQDELGFELALVGIGGDAELEARYRERLPVVEVDGRPAFTYFVPPDALRALLR